MNYVQTERPMRVSTTLGDDKFLLAGIQGHEAISSPFAFHLDLRSTDPAVDGASLLRTAVSVVIDTDPAHPPRCISGLISRFVQLGRRDDLTAYYAEMVPWIWMLSLVRDCRIFQDLSVLEIVQQIFQERGYQPTQHFRVATTKAYAKREYCVQYRETDLDFVSRLLEEEGIFYYFEHTDTKHVLTLADANNTAPVSPSTPKARMRSADSQQDVISALRSEYAVHPGKVTIRDYDFLQPSLSLEGSISGTGPEEVYDYPGGFTTMDAGDRLARLQLEADEALEQLIRCTSSCRGVQAGTRFDLEEHYRSELNQNYLILETSLSASAENFRGWDGTGFDYQNEFVAIPSKTPFHPQRRTPRPVMPASQTAVVVGKPGEEVWVDKYARVKIQFHWDRRGKKDDTSSCWVRVLTPWGGKGYGGVSIPRIGNEVIVSFIEGDPDRPIITGSVYNADQMPPYTLPGAGIQMGMKSRSSPGGGGTNEITMTDTKGKELINIHAQYDMTTTVEHDRTTSVKNNDTQSVTVDRTIDVGGKQTEHVAKDVAESYDGAQATKVAKDITIDSTGGAITIVSDSAKITVKAATQIQLEVGASSISMDAGGAISIKGVDIAIKGDASVAIKGLNVSSEADAQNSTKGALVISDGSATNTVKGGMVMLNP